MARRLLLVAFHFPPLAGSTGIHRALSFARFLPEFGWEVAVLTADVRAYPEVSHENSGLVPPGLQVFRAFALDTKRHLAVGGRYPHFLAVPDRWQSWIAGGTAAGLGVLRRWRPDVVMTTYPIASAHSIGAKLARFTRVPWVADFRDPMAQDGYPEDPRLHRAFLSIERRIFERAAHVTVTTAGTGELYAARYPEYPRDAISVIPNGFDDSLIDHLAPTTRETPAGAALTLLHSGLLDPRDRNPDAFFHALADLMRDGTIARGQLRVNLRATRHDGIYRQRIRDLGLEDVVSLLPPIPYEAALREIASADILLLFQAANCNRQIPAKIYEYLFAGRPVVGLTDPVGDTGQLLTSLGYRSVAGIDDVAGIKRVLADQVARVRSGTTFTVSREVAMRFSRKGAARTLAGVLDGVADGVSGASRSR